MERTAENYQQFRKDLITKLKEWEKQYNKHVKKKGPHDQMFEEIQTVAMKPLTTLLAKNYFFGQLEEMIKRKEEVPEFRYSALEQEFCKGLTTFIEILQQNKAFDEIEDTGEEAKDGSKIYKQTPVNIHFNVWQLLATLKLKNWECIRPFEFFISKLLDKTVLMRKELVHLYENGPLWCRYDLKENTVLVKRTKDLLLYDNLV